jgi:hypothetical protein
MSNLFAYLIARPTEMRHRDFAVWLRNIRYTAHSENGEDFQGLKFSCRRFHAAVERRKSGN